MAVNEDYIINITRAMMAVNEDYIINITRAMIAVNEDYFIFFNGTAFIEACVVNVGFNYTSVLGTLIAQ